MIATAARPVAVRGLVSEAGLFALGIAVMALHVIDDGFLQPQRGTTAADHLVSGLVPLAPFRARRLGYPRLRGGRRGALALVFGVFGLRRERRGRPLRGPAGDDYSGFAAIPAGLLLLGARRDHAMAHAPDGRAPVRRAPRCSASPGLFVFLFCVLPVGMSYVNVHVARAVVPAPHLGAAARGRHADDERWPEAEGLVRPVA